MATAMRALQRLAMGQETTPGTAVDPSRIVPHLDGSTFTENENRQPLAEPRGVLAMVDDVLTERGSTLELQQELDWDLCLPVFLAGIANDPAPDNTGNVAPFTYSMAAGVEAPATPASFTPEVRAARDGAADHILRRFSHARVTQFALEWQRGGTTRLNSTWMGGAAVTPSAAQVLAASQLATRRIVPAALWDLAIDDAWDDLGSTSAVNVRGIALAVTTGWTPSMHFRGRQTLDLDGWYPGMIEGTLTLTYDLDAAAAAEVEHWRRGDLRFVQLHASNGGAAGAARSINFDIAGRVIDSPNLLGSDGEQSVVELALQLRSDASGDDDDIFEVTVESGLSGWATLAPPDAPRALVVTAGDDQLGVAWNAPAGGTAVARYRVRYRVRGSANPWLDTTTAANTRTATLTGLVSGATYDVEVRSENSGGNSAWVAGVGTTT